MAQQHDVQDWRRDALCAPSRSTLTWVDFFFEGRFKRGSGNHRDHLARLAATCATCPVRTQCDDLAERTETEDGYYAGLAIDDRIARRRGVMSGRSQAE